MLRLRRKKRGSQAVDENRLREIMQSELAIHDAIVKAKNEKEREKQVKLARIKALPKSKRNQFLRFLDRRKGK